MLPPSVSSTRWSRRFAIIRTTFTIVCITHCAPCKYSSPDSHWIRRYLRGSWSTSMSPTSCLPFALLSSRGVSVGLFVILRAFVRTTPPGPFAYRGFETTHILSGYQIIIIYLVYLQIS
ncbi:hypothetical protein EV421DRAFT_1790680 [Armillaria borealis]|uniref:Uncharacterized protein n=1 Tax=Armillaria borealis TaxID=47425 RepID=A0AA39JPS1_9AGAR|nr:hypothetical protein EV421DRAFT_1790680 [Armillaria borealis]